MLRALTEAALLSYARRVPYHRGKQRLTEHLVSLLGLSLTGETIERREGLLWSLDPADYVCQDLFWSGAKDRVQITRVREIMKPDGVMLDLGANFGYYAVTIASALKDRCTIHAFEPNARVRARLQTNLQLNHLHSVHVHGVGLWDRAGEVSLVEDAGNSGAAHVAPGRDVQVTTVDDFCNDQHITRLDLMKIDVEGSEVHVLRGARETIERLRPTLLIELNNQALKRAGTTGGELLDLLERHRYAYEPIRSGQTSRAALVSRTTTVDLLCRPR